MRKNYIFYGIIFVIFISLKLWVKQADNDDLLLLLSPISYLISFFNEENSVYSLELGYFFQHLNININKGCSGFNFLMMSFVLSAFLIVQIFRKWWMKSLAIIGIFFINYLITIVVNFSRISIAILMSESNIPILKSDKLHLLEGGVIYFSTLVIIYLFLNNYILPHYEKSFKS